MDKYDDYSFEDMPEDEVEKLYPIEEDYDYLCENDKKCIRLGLYSNLFERLFNIIN